MKRLLQGLALRLALLYALFGALWIVLSDRLIAGLGADLAVVTRLQTYKGWAFVAASALLIFGFLHRDNLLRQAAEAKLRQNEAELHRLNAELERRVLERTAQLTAVNEELEAFSYALSHDLRAPLRAINGFAAILMRRHQDNLNPEGQHYLNNIFLASERMGQMSDDLLRYAHIGRSGVRRARVPLADVLAEVVSDVRGRLEAKGGRIEIAADLPTVNGEPILLRQIFANLVENALTYCRPDTPPEIHISHQTDGAYTIVRVADNGIGIPTEYQQKIFDIFQRLHNQSEYPGTGIGLAAVKKAVSLLDGDIEVASAPGLGATFSVKLPRG